MSYYLSFLFFPFLFFSIRGLWTVDSRFFDRIKWSRKVERKREREREREREKGNIER